jgi:pilus assembly protein CpaC
VGTIVNATPGTGAFSFGVVSGDSTFMGFLDVLEQDRLARVLAAPTLVTVSGRPASVHVGGEIPASIYRSNGSETIQYRKCGTSVGLMATVTDGENIRLEVRPRVSEIDTANSVRIGDKTFPGLRVREAEVGVEMRSGQTMAISGLLQNRTTARQVGSDGDDEAACQTCAANRAKDQTEEIELIVLVTPQIVERPEQYERSRLGSIPLQSPQPTKRPSTAAATRALPIPSRVQLPTGRKETR